MYGGVGGVGGEFGCGPGGVARERREGPKRATEGVERGERVPRFAVWEFSVEGCGRL